MLKTFRDIVWTTAVFLLLAGAVTLGLWGAGVFLKP